MFKNKQVTSLFTK